MSCKLLAIDLDDTLLCDDLTISNENKAALVEAENQGVKIVLCTGRAFASTYDYACELGFNKEGRYCICLNGAALYNPLLKKVLYEKLIPLEYAHFLIDFASNYDVDVQLYLDEQMLVEKITPRIEKYISNKIIPYDVVGNLRSFLKCDISKVLFNGKNSVHQEIVTDLHEWTVGKTNMFFSKPEFLEFTNIDANKGKTLMYLADKLNINPENVFAVGDSYNDIYMIEAAGFGVAVGNANNDVKEKADCILSCSNEQNAIAELIEKYVLC